MDLDDANPRPGDPVTVLMRQDLDPLSVEECDMRISALNAEIARTQTHRDKAVNHRASAESVFKR